LFKADYGAETKYVSPRPENPSRKGQPEGNSTPRGEDSKASCTKKKGERVWAAGATKAVYWLAKRDSGIASKKTFFFEVLLLQFRETEGRQRGGRGKGESSQGDGVIIYTYSAVKILGVTQQREKKNGKDASKKTSLYHTQKDLCPSSKYQPLET